VDPVPDPLLLRKSGSAGNGTRTSWLAARSINIYIYMNFSRAKNVRGHIKFGKPDTWHIETMVVTGK
jgi:hypothetical protein